MYAISRVRIEVEESPCGSYETFEDAKAALVRYCEDIVIHTRKLEVQADNDLKRAVELANATKGE